MTWYDVFNRYFDMTLGTSFVQAQRKVAVMGASGGIGQPLSMLLKNSPLVTRLSLYDIVHTPGVAADLSHIESPAKVTGYVGPEQLPVSTLILFVHLSL